MNIQCARRVAGLALGLCGMLASCPERALAQTGEERKGNAMLTQLATNAQGRVAVLSSVAASFRESATDDPQAAVGYHFSQNAKSQWNVKVSSEIVTQQQQDFFLGAMLLAGSQNENGGIVGLYNPWWDAVLLLRFDGKGGDDVTGASVRVVEFYLLSGETFRGENATGPVVTRTVVPQEEPLSVELWRVCSCTRKVFAEKFPLEASPTWTRLASVLLSLDHDKEMERIQTRSGLRMQHYLGYLKNTRHVWLGTYTEELLRTGAELKLRQHFQEPNARPLLETFIKLPDSYRQELSLYCYLPTKEGCLFVYVNKQMPRLYATVTMKLNPKPTAKTTSLEWYDLFQCDELLNAWNGRKEVSK